VITANITKASNDDDAIEAAVASRLVAFLSSTFFRRSIFAVILSN